MAKTYDEDSSFLVIDSNNLEKEWVDQPRLYFKYATKLENAREDFEQAKAELGVVAAECDLDIRNNPAKYDLPKATEKSVEAAVAMHDDYVAAAKEVSVQRHRVGVFQAAVNALDHRKKALEKLVELFLANYYSAPRAPAGSTELMDRQNKRRALRGE